MYANIMFEGGISSNRLSNKELLNIKDPPISTKADGAPLEGVREY